MNAIIDPFREDQNATAQTPKRPGIIDPWAGSGADATASASVPAIKRPGIVDPWSQPDNAAPASLAAAIKRPDRSWGEAAVDRVMGIGAAGLDAIGSTVKFANQRTPLDRIPGGATAFAGAEALTGLAKMASPILPDAVNRKVDDARGALASMRAADPNNLTPRSEFADAFANTASEYASDARGVQSDKEKATQQRLAEVSEEGFWPALKEVATNPSALATAADSLPSMLAAGGGAGGAARALATRAGAGAVAAGRIATSAQLGTMSAMEGAGAGQGAFDAVMEAKQEVLDDDPVYLRLVEQIGDPARAREALAQMARSAAGGTGTAASLALMGLGERLGLNVVEDAVLGRALRGAGSSRIGNTIAGGAREFVGEAAEGAANQLAQNTGAMLAGVEDDPMRGVGGAAALEGAVGAATGGARGLVTTPQQAPATGTRSDDQPAEPLALPPPGAITVDAEGNAMTPAQAREWEELGLTPDVLNAQAQRQARQAVVFPDAAPGSLADAANTVPQAAPTLPDGSPLPDPANGPLSRAVNDGAVSGAIPGFRTWEQMQANITQDAQEVRQRAQREREMDEIANESRLPAALYDAEVSRASGRDEVASAPTAMELALQRAQAKNTPAGRPGIVDPWAESNGGESQSANLRSAGNSVGYESQAGRPAIVDPWAESDTTSHATPSATGILAAPITPPWMNPATGESSTPTTEQVRAAVEQQVAAQVRHNGRTGLNSAVLSRAWGVPQKDIARITRQVRANFDPASVESAPVDMRGNPGSITTPVNTRNSVQARAPIVDPFASPQASTATDQPAESRPDISYLRDEIGWAERGGRILRDAERPGGIGGDVVGRTQWVPKFGPNGDTGFWRNRPEGISEDIAREALRKHEAGENLTTRQQRFIDYAMEHHRQQQEEALGPTEEVRDLRRRALSVDNALAQQTVERFDLGEIDTGRFAQEVAAAEVQPAEFSDVPFSRAKEQAITGLPVENVQRIADDFQRRYRGNIPLQVRVGATVDALYGVGADQLESLRSFKGAYHPRRGIVALAADRLSSRADVEATLRHEILGHYGLNTLAPADKRAVLEAVLTTRNQRSLAPLWAQVDALYADMPDTVRAEEVFAELASRERGTLGEWWDRILALLARGLRNAGLLRGSTTKAELHDLARRIAEGIRSGERTQQTFPESDQAQFARADAVDSPAFQRWFGNSQVTDASGRPRVVYHGTGSDFWAFDAARLGENTGHLTAPLGFFFTENRTEAQRYAEKASEGVPADERLIDVYLSIQNPKVMTLEQFHAIDSFDDARAVREQLQRQGHDGIRLTSNGRSQWIAFAPTQAKSASQNRGSFDPADPDMRFNRAPDATVTPMRLHGIPATAGEPAFLFRNDQPLKNHPSYRAAKAGDPAAAVELVRDLAEPLRAVAERLGPDVVYVAPHAIEATGDNAIPQTLAAFLAVAGGARSDTAIAQSNRVFHTGANAMQRLIAPSEFIGEVEPGARYVMVDDVTTMGGTLADLAGYIQANGGQVAGSVVLTNAARDGKLHATPAQLRMIERRFGNEIREVLRIEPAALTAEEAKYLIGFRTADELRNRAVAATEERDRRLRAKGVFDANEGSLTNDSPAPPSAGPGRSGVVDPLGTDVRFSRAPAPQTDPFAEENRRLREQDKTIWQRAKKILRREFAPGGLLPEKVFGEKIVRDSNFQAVEFDVRHLAGALEKAVKQDFGKALDQLPEAKVRQLADTLAGKVPGNLPAETRTALVAMRQYIDALSGEYLGIIQGRIDALVAQAAASGKEQDAARAINEIDLYEKIKGNIGQYVHRSYRAFDDPQWFKKVPTEALNAARRYLAEGYLEQGTAPAEARRLADVVINEILKNGTAYDSMESFIAEGKLGAKDLSVLMRRKEVPPEIRALLGEYTDPRVNFAKSATKMGRLIWNQRFLDRVREMGMGSFLFDGKDRPASATAQLAAEGSDVMAPLNGLWTFPEVAQAFKDALGKEQMGNMYRAMVRFNGMVKYGKTVLSPTTAMRNWNSALFFSLANGHFDLTQSKKGFIALREQVLGHVHHGVRNKLAPNLLRDANTGELAYLRRLKELGVVYDTPYAGEMARYIEDARLEELFDGKNGTGLRALKKLNEMAQGFYSFGDDFWKIIGFENEKASLLKAGIPVAQAETMAAERIRNTYPTYSMVGRGVKWLSRFPLVGTFVSFPAEIVRTSANMLQLTAADLKSDNPGIRAIGLKRVAGMALVSAGFYALSAITRAMFGVGDDEEEALRDLAPPWQKNSTFLYTGRDSEGKLRYFDMSFLDPYGYWKRPVTAMMRDQPWQDSAASAVGDLLEPFFGTDISAGAIFEVMANKKGAGGRVYSPTGDPVDQTLDIANHLRKALQPGFMGNAERLWLAGNGVRREGSGQPYDMHDEVVSLLGWRASTLDTRTALYYRSFEFSDALASARQSLTRTLRSSNTVTREDIQKSRASAERQYEDAFRQMHRLVASARAAGMTQPQIMRTLRLSGVSAENAQALVAGKTPPMRIGIQSARNAMQQAHAMQGPAQAREVARRFQQAGAR